MSKGMIFSLEIASLPPHSLGVTDLEKNIEQALASPENQGEMTDADSVGTVGSPDCGDMMRMWLKFSEKDGKRVIDRASFQSFGCQTAIAVASMATELLKGKTLEDARNLAPDDLSGDLGPLPPMKVHCGQLVEGALRNALDGTPADTTTDASPTLAGSLQQKPKGTIKIVPLEDDDV